jgi:hypothetical protein
MTYERRNPFTPFTPLSQREPPEDTRKVGPPRPPDPKAAAAAIIRAGKLRRNELVEDTRPPLGSLGRAILDAAAKARGEQVK